MWPDCDLVQLPFNFDRLIDGELDAPFDATAAGGSSAGTVWTGTASDGTATGDDCTDWSNNNVGNGTIGNPNNTSAAWTNHAPDSCAQSNPFYCLEQ